MANDATSVALIAEYRPLLEYAKRLTRNGSEAHDLVHATLVRALWEGSEDGSDFPENVGAWLRTVLFRLFVDERRRSSKERSFDLSLLDQIEGIQDTENIEEPPPSWSCVSIEDVRQALPLLPRRFREPYVLFAFQQLSYKDIAIRLELSVATVGTRIARARSKLRLLLRAAYVEKRELGGAAADSARGSSSERF
ncbi:RNA polymerase sigma factor [Pendulispora albinea]|uniref:Sigma-70 family RNA polymerase sigma factor n=1 Tax=Pendulispora albinea TaxID=2741071 RepID=A0ABZ2MAT1_9BACT